MHRTLLSCARLIGRLLLAAADARRDRDGLPVNAFARPLRGSARCRWFHRGAPRRPLVGQSGRCPRYGVVGAPRDRCGRQAPRHGNPVGDGCRHAGARGAGLVPPPVGGTVRGEIPPRPGPLLLEWPFAGAHLALAARRDSVGGIALDVSDGVSGATSRQTACSGGHRDARIGRLHEGRVEPTLGFEPRTCCLRNSCSTAELCRRGAESSSEEPGGQRASRNRGPASP